MPEANKLAVETFFQLLDGYSPEAASKWSDLYQRNGDFQAFGKVFKGREGTWDLQISYPKSTLYHRDNPYAKAESFYLSI